MSTSPTATVRPAGRLRRLVVIATIGLATTGAVGVLSAASAGAQPIKPVPTTTTIHTIEGESTHKDHTGEIWLAS